MRKQAVSPRNQDWRCSRVAPQGAVAPRRAAACWPQGGNAGKERQRGACSRSAATCWPKWGTAGSTEIDAVRARAVAPRPREHARQHPVVSVCSSAAYRTRAVVPTRVGAAVYPNARALAPVRGRARCPRVCTAPPLGVGARGGAAVPQVPTRCGSTAVRAVRSSAPRSLQRGCTAGAVRFSCGGGGTGG